MKILLLPFLKPLDEEKHQPGNGILMSIFLRLISAMFSLLALTACAAGVTSSKDDLMFYLLSEVQQPQKTFLLKFYVQDDGALDNGTSADISLFTVQSDSVNFNLIIEETEFLLSSIDVFPYSPASASALRFPAGDYSAMHTDHLSGIADESSDPLTGGPFTLRDFHIIKNTIQIGDVFESDFLKMTGSFSGDYISAKLNTERFRIQGRITAKPGTAEELQFPFEVSSEDTFFYADSDCRTSLGSASSDSKNYIFKLNELFKDSLSASDPKLLHTLYLRYKDNGTLPVINPRTNSDLLAVFNSNFAVSLKEYGCINGRYIY